MLDTLPAFNFYIALIEDPDSVLGVLGTGAAMALGGFSECSGLESEIQVEERLAGGQNDRVFRFATRAAYPNIVLTRGMGLSDDLYRWHEEFRSGAGRRRDGLIFLAGEQRAPIKAWMFEKGIPVKWSGPALNATTSAAAIERLEIAHERLSLTMSPGDALGSALAGGLV